MMEWLLALNSAAAIKFSSARSADTELKSKLDQEDADELTLEAAQLGVSK